MVQSLPKDQRDMVYCRLCKSYDVKACQATAHLRKVHGVTKGDKRDLTSIKFFVFSEVHQ